MSSPMPASHSNVYVPTEPEGNGIGLPMLFSLVMHLIVIALILYTTRQHLITPPVSLETTIVTADELAALQGQIMANREALLAASAGAATASQLPTDVSPSQTSPLQAAEPNTHSSRVPIFMPSNEPASTRAIDEYRETLQEQQRQYDEAIAQFARQIDQEMSEKQQAQIDALRAEQREQRLRLQEYTQAERDISNIEAQNREALNEARERQERERAERAAAASTASQSSSLGRDGVATSGSSGSAPRSQAGGGSASSARGNARGAVVASIERHFSPPSGSQNQRTTLSIRVDSSGRVLGATASGADNRVNEAAERAVYAASPLPIDTNDSSTYPNITVNLTGRL